MASLDRHDRAGSRQQGWITDELAGSVVGGNANVLERGGGGQEGLGIGDAEVVLGGRDRLAAELG